MYNPRKNILHLHSTHILGPFTPTMSLLFLQESWAISGISVFLSLYRCWNRGSEKPRGFSKTSSTVIEWTQLLLLGRKSRSFSWCLCRKPAQWGLCYRPCTGLDRSLGWELSSKLDSSIYSLCYLGQVTWHVKASICFCFSIYKRGMIALDYSESIKVSTQGTDLGKRRWRVALKGQMKDNLQKDCVTGESWWLYRTTCLTQAITSSQ